MLLGTVVLLVLLFATFKKLPFLMVSTRAQNGITNISHRVFVRSEHGNGVECLPESREVADKPKGPRAVIPEITFL